MPDDSSSASGVPDLEGLTAFAALGDRDDARFFVGRRHEIANVERLCAEALRAAHVGRPRKGLTQLFQGAPGAGKSSLLSELASRWREAALEAQSQDALGEPRGTPLAVRLDWGDLLFEEVVARKILAAVAPDAEELSRRTRTGSATGSLDAGLVRGSLQAGGATTPPTLSIEGVAELFPPGGWTRPVCLMVDEIQNVEPGAANVLTRLHEGHHGLPVVPVFAGLGSSQGVLQRFGLYRFSMEAVHDVGCLAGSIVPAETGIGRKCWLS